MIREYATLIIEYANSQNALSTDIILEDCRPPFNSKWPYDIFTKEELLSREEIYGLSYSLYDFGDFQKYSMRCVENWSNTPIDDEDFISGTTLQENFLYELNEQAQELYEEYIELDNQESILYDEALEKDYSPLDIFIGNLKEENKKLYDEYSQNEIKIDKKKEAIKNQLFTMFSKEEKLKFEELDHLYNEKHIQFDIDIAARLVHEKVIELGWTNKYFKSFDSTYSHDTVSRYSDKRIERIGKKYQWIALYELLAKLSDNFKRK
ncbi:hypothetical protein [Maledivibacter halophilus]|nr:hypothetical protein [Maledivibacter halophilus]